MTDTGTRRSAPRPRERHPLLHPFPLIVLTLATFLVVFTLMMAGLRSASTALPPGGTSAKVALVNGRRLVVKTTPSGRVVATGAQAAGSAPAATPAIVTSSSGAGAGDD